MRPSSALALAALAALVGGTAWQFATYQPPPARAAAPTPTAVVAVPNTAACRDAATLPAALAYRAPGATVGLKAAVASHLADDPRPHDRGTWYLRRGTAPGTCALTLELTLGNEPTTFAWTYTLATQRVSADDARARWVSGW
jgi:hypothetical protein